MKAGNKVKVKRHNNDISNLTASRGSYPRGGVEQTIFVIGGQSLILRSHTGHTLSRTSLSVRLASR